MPTNKEALVRYRVINRCMKESKYASMDKLIRSCEDALSISPISRRTIYQDIHDMKTDERLGYFAPIKLDRDRMAYYYEDVDYSIDKLPLTDEEVHALSFSATMLEQYSNVGIFSTFTGAVQKVVEAMNIHRWSEEEDLFPFIEFEQSPGTLGNQYIEPLIMAIKDKKVIQFSYQRFDVDKPYTHRVHPYLLKQYHNRWYLIGWNNDMKAIYTYSLDRFVSDPETIDLPYYDIGFNTREYFKSVIGIIAPTGKPVNIVLRLTKFQAWYVITQPIHSSQLVSMKEDDDYATVQLKVIPTYELTNLIMGWGPDVEVIQPVALRKEIFRLHMDCVKKVKIK
jgi:predicted DNA-binding transcriptional regulator YafY